MPSRRHVLAGFAGAALAAGAVGLPTAAADSYLTRAKALARRMTLEQKIGQLFVVEVGGTAAGAVDATAQAFNQRLYGVNTPAEVIAKYQPGGVILFATRGVNMTGVRQIAGLTNGLQQAALGTPAAAPLIISTDQEGGARVSRMPAPATQLPGNMALGSGRSVANVYRSAEITARELAAVGINQNYGPCADVNLNPDNTAIGVRSFSDEAKLAAPMAAAAVLGHSRGGTASAAKHFPGHGDTAVDSHFGLPEIKHTRAELDAIDLPPFRAAIAAGLETIMTAHIVVKSLDDSGAPATMSHKILTGLLRDELGFKGLIVTDALDMQGAAGEFPPDVAPVRAFQAGADMLVLATKMDIAVASVTAAVGAGDISTDRLDASVVRILAHKLRQGLYDDPYVSPNRAERVVGNSTHVSAAAAITRPTVTLVKNTGGLLPLAKQQRKVLVTGWGVATTTTIAQSLTARGQTVTTLETGSVPAQAKIDEAVAAAAQADLVVLSSHALANAADKGQAQAVLAQALLGTGKPVVVLGVGVPYDIRRFPSAPAYVTTCNYGATSVQTAVAVLFGEVSPTGKLPVTVRSLDGSEVLYPYGHGLSY
ncbi:glycoside hydrolase family 3 protein [Streptomyces sp. A7024]|uniref:beta-N-acetylhexosaminidase n=1 Tax=Streptomyces coryli TaxID=1128680 RepID=A0A6G4U4C7_9ACTN|nr:glycoside hydrolase family 3 protein [Streptomyces coryli]NGN66943.1 glycoside hydrolase family 3 protein [Streptomyces coryli]